MRALVHEVFMVVSSWTLLHNFASEMIRLSLSQDNLFFPDKFFYDAEILTVSFFEATINNLLSFFFLSVDFIDLSPLFLVATVSAVDLVAVDSVAVESVVGDSVAVELLEIDGVVSTIPIIIRAVSVMITKVPFARLRFINVLLMISRINQGQTA